MKSIAVIGATGLLAQPVVGALIKRGFRVTVVGRSLAKLKQTFNEDVIYKEADIHNLDSLTEALNGIDGGIDGVHINLSGNDPESCFANQVNGTKNIVNVASKLGIKRITYLSGTTSFQENAWFYDTKAKLEAENIIKNSGLEYLVFCPSWFMETLPLFVQNGRATVFGKTTQPIKWIAADDYAQMVASSYQQNKQLNQRVYIHGPEALDMFSALKLYTDNNAGLKLGRMPYWFGSLLATLTKNTDLKNAVSLLKYYEIVGEKGDASIANSSFGKPNMSLQQWLKTTA